MYGLFDKTLEPRFKNNGLYKSYLHSLCGVDIAHNLRRLTAAVADTARSSDYLFSQAIFA